MTIAILDKTGGGGGGEDAPAEGEGSRQSLTSHLDTEANKRLFGVLTLILKQTPL